MKNEESLELVVTLKAPRPQGNRGNRTRKETAGIGEALPGASSSPTDPLLTPRENEVMACFSEGMLYKETAFKLGISYSSVHNHQHEIYLKYHVTNKIEAVARWMQGRQINKRSAWLSERPDTLKPT